MSTKDTVLAMWTAWAIATASTNSDLISNTISYWVWIIDTIINKTWLAVDTILNTWNWTASAILPPLAAVYWWVKVWEFLDEKFLKFENKWLKWATRVWGGLIWLANTPTAAVIWTWIWAWKAWNWAVKWLGSLWKKAWNIWYSKKSST